MEDWIVLDTVKKENVLFNPVQYFIPNMHRAFGQNVQTEEESPKTNYLERLQPRSLVYEACSVHL